MRIILVAENASTRFGGEAFLPMNYFRLLLSRKADVRLVVHARNRAELTQSFPDELERLHFVEDTWFHKVLFRLGTHLPRRLAEATTGLLIQITTQRSQRSVVRQLVKQFQIDVVHQPIPVSPKAPSQLYGVGAPVVIGPLNGGMDYPPAFRKKRGFVANLGLSLGRAAAEFFNVIIPGKLRAALILVSNHRTYAALPRGVKGRVVELVENGVDFSIWQRKVSRPPTDATVRFVFIGRLVDLKALDIVLEAIYQSRHQAAISLEVIGDGPMQRVWEEKAAQLDLSSIVKFSGFMSQTECAHRLQQADVLVFPSLHDCGGAAILEAMATGLPVVATAWGGPLDYLDESCGILVQPDSREALVAGFSQAIVKLAKSPDLRDRLGKAGQVRAQQKFDWERKIDCILEMYASVA
jgi:glycosyltransferase involved in cell wall biosynthesis